MQTKRGATQNDPSELLSLIGTRVRALRARRGISRKLLALDSEVSERHLAQLELGKGNMSIALLDRVAGALDTDLGDLVRGGQHQTAEQVLIDDLLHSLSTIDLKAALELLHSRYLTPVGGRHRVALVGLRGAGKTTLGEQLARCRKVPFVRLVAEIERLAGMDASEIFELSGQSGYRRLEKKALTKTLSRYRACVIEAGGSIVAEPGSFNLLLTSCTVVWIRALPEQHMQRVIDQGDLRPMAGNADAMSDLKWILQEREPFYAKAHHILDTSARSVDECAGELARMIINDEIDCRTPEPDPDPPGADSGAASNRDTTGAPRHSC
jgi:XRE family aerobic/anaerobic benzoate catabolism transcriptional regulator